jgi:dihydrofolate reductase
MSVAFDFIVAMTEARVIGYRNQLPWRLPQDLKRFKQITSGNTVIMGRKTFESIGRPLPNRKNIVLTRDPRFRAEGVLVCHDWDSLDAHIQGTAFVIGGGEIFAQALPRLRRLYLTVIYKDFEGDAFFPDLKLERDFVLEEKSEKFTDPFEFDFQTWVKKH